MNSILLALILIPIIEIYLLIKIGSQIGAITTILLIFTTAIVGVYYAKYEGLNTLKSGFMQLSQNKQPAYEIISGAAIAFAALLLIIPGFATDLFGFLIIFPFSRKLLFNLLNKKNYKKENSIKNFNELQSLLEKIRQVITTHEPISLMKAYFSIVDNISEWNNVLPPLKKIDDPENHKLVLILNELVKKIDPLIANT